MTSNHVTARCARCNWPISAKSIQSVHEHAEAHEQYAHGRDNVKLLIARRD